MKRQILTYPMEKDQIQDELNFMIRYFLEKGVTSCKVLFGFAWGNDYYGDNDWEEEEIPLETLAAKVREVEALDIGKFGDDNLSIYLPSYEVLFCHESDIHLYFDDVGNSDAEFFYARWEELGYQPAEYVHNEEEKGPGLKVR